jgi:Demerecviridae HNH endonuclease
MNAAYLRKILHYNKRTGVFTWRVRRYRVHVGMIAGGIDNGYIRIKINGKKYSAHRLACLYVTGAWPAKTIDHKDLNGTNNKWVNLRQATHSQQRCNSKPISKFGFKGIFKKKKLWQAVICINRKRFYLGHYSTAAMAHAAYAAAAKRVHGEFARTK